MNTTSYEEHPDKYVQNAGTLSVLCRHDVEEREGFPNQRAEDTVCHLLGSMSYMLMAEIRDIVPVSEFLP